MYEDFLEEFVYSTAKEIAMKLFGRFVSKRSNRRKKTKAGTSKQLELLLEQQKQLTATESVEVSGEPTEEQRMEQELDKMFKETVERQKKKEAEKNEEEVRRREEYEGIKEGLTPLHFHFTLFLFLVVLTLLNLPSAITWAKNFEHTRQMIDASTVPAVLTISALAVIWQMNTPRTMVQGYQVLAMVLYGMALVTIIYCLDSPFLLNNIIATIFVLVALQQVFSPRIVVELEEPTARVGGEEEEEEGKVEEVNEDDKVDEEREEEVK